MPRRACVFAGRKVMLRASDIKQMMGNTAALCDGNFRGAQIEPTIELYRVVIYDFAIRPQRDLDGQMRFAGPGWTSNSDQRLPGVHDSRFHNSAYRALAGTDPMTARPAVMKRRCSARWLGTDPNTEKIVKMTAAMPIQHPFMRLCSASDVYGEILRKVRTIKADFRQAKAHPGCSGCGMRWKAGNLANCKTKFKLAAGHKPADSLVAFPIRFFEELAPMPD